MAPGWWLAEDALLDGECAQPHVVWRPALAARAAASGVPEVPAGADESSSSAVASPAAALADPSAAAASARTRARRRRAAQLDAHLVESTAHALLSAAKLVSMARAQTPQVILRGDVIVSLPQRCDNLVQLVRQRNPAVVLSQADFIVAAERVSLCDGARRVLAEPNAGGTSVWSEALSVELLFRVFDAELDLTEMEIRYMPSDSKKTDYSVKMRAHGRSTARIGVSVTRAMKYGGLFTDDDARVLLHKKLHGVICSSMNVCHQHKWCRQILHVWAESSHVARTLIHVYQRMDETLRSNTVILITICHNASWLFREEELYLLRMRSASADQPATVPLLPHARPSSVAAAASAAPARASAKLVVRSAFDASDARSSDARRFTI